MSNRCPYCGAKKRETHSTCDSTVCIDEDVRRFSLNYGNDHEIVGPSMTVDSIGRCDGSILPRKAKRHFAEDDRANGISSF